MRSSARSSIATAATTKTCIFANALQPRRRATRFYCRGQVGGQEYSEFSNSNAFDFIGSGNRYESTTRNIPELGISTGIPLTEYRLDVVSTRLRRLAAFAADCTP